MRLRKKQEEKDGDEKVRDRFSGYIISVLLGRRHMPDR